MKKNSDGIKKGINKKIIILIAIILLIIPLFFAVIRFTGNVVGQITGSIIGNAVSTALYNCTDSDNGLNYFEKGICNNGKKDYVDGCYNKKGLWEYYCGKDRYSCIMQETACPYGCIEGRCLKKGENIAVDNPVINPPENNLTPENNPIVKEENSPDVEIVKNSYWNIIIAILIIIVLIFVILYFFRKKSVTLKKSSVRLKWK